MPAGPASMSPIVARRGVVRRGALLERLSGAGAGAVVLVCAPAGSGKTVLLRSWIEAMGRQARVGWVSVERGERDAGRFWRSVIDALAGAVESVQRVDPAPTFQGEAVVEQLLADLGSLEAPAVLVVDDLHELRSVDALGWFDRFPSLLPAMLRVVPATRETPQLVAELAGAERYWSLDRSEGRQRCVVHVHECEAIARARRASGSSSSPARCLRI